MKFTSLVAAFASISLVSATNFTVAVGENNGLTYDPPFVMAAEGDTIAFQFKAKNHSVTQSTFANPCTSSGVDSGFMPVAANATVIPQWSFTINNASAPLWFFCAQTGHCAKGMVFAVNPTAAKSFDMFQAAANATGGNTTATPSSSTGTSVGPSAVVSPTQSAGANGAMSKMSLSSATTILAAIGLIAGVAL